MNLRSEVNKIEITSVSFKFILSNNNKSAYK